MKIQKVKIGDKFNKLTVIKFLCKTKFSHKKWLCLCECGNEIEIDEYTLLKNARHSCGCERNIRMKQLSTKHNLYGTKIYQIWISMKQRCYYKKYTHYKHYGSKGIEVCDEWKNNVVQFYNWALSNGYKEGLSIERIDINKNYCPENCKWIPKNEQQMNTSKTKKYKYQNEEHTLHYFSKLYSIPSTSLYRKIKNGVNIELAINELKNKKEKKDGKNKLENIS